MELGVEGPDLDVAETGEEFGQPGAVGDDGGGRPAHGGPAGLDRQAGVDPRQRSAGHVDRIDALAPEPLGGLEAAGPGAADDRQGALGRHLVDPLHQVTQGDQDHAGDMGLVVLVGVADVEDGHAGRRAGRASSATSISGRPSGQGTWARRGRASGQTRASGGHVGGAGPAADGRSARGPNCRRLRSGCPGGWTWPGLELALGVCLGVGPTGGRRGVGVGEGAGGQALDAHDDQVGDGPVRGPLPRVEGGLQHRLGPAVVGGVQELVAAVVPGGGHVRVAQREGDGPDGVGVGGGQVAGQHHDHVLGGGSERREDPAERALAGMEVGHAVSPSALRASRSPPTAMTGSAPAARRALATRRASGTPSTSSRALSVPIRRLPPTGQHAPRRERQVRPSRRRWPRGPGWPRGRRRTSARSARNGRRPGRGPGESIRCRPPCWRSRCQPRSSMTSPTPKTSRVDGAELEDREVGVAGDLQAVDGGDARPGSSGWCPGRCRPGAGSPRRRGGGPPSRPRRWGPRPGCRRRWTSRRGRRASRRRGRTGAGRGPWRRRGPSTRPWSSSRTCGRRRRAR